MAKPRVDMDKLGIPKAAAAAAVPFAKPPSPEPPPPLGGGKSLTVKLEAPEYRALRDYCIAHEHATGEKLTHQHVMVAALKALIERGAAA